LKYLTAAIAAIGLALTDEEIERLEPSLRRPPLERPDGADVSSLSFHERGELAEGRLRPQAVVGSRDAGRQVLVGNRHIGTVVSVGKRGRHCHRALKQRVVGFELEHLGDLLVGDQPEEAAVIGVGVSTALARDRRIA
jgi:hypothetical protein